MKLIEILHIMSTKAHKLLRSPANSNEEIDYVGKFIKEAGFDYTYLSDGIEVSNHFGNLFLRNNESDFNVFGQVFHKQEYQPIIQLCQENAIKPETIVDLGANIGLATFYLLSHFPLASVLCVEPGEDNIALAKKNLSDMGDVSFLQAAVWYKAGSCYLNRNFRDGLDWSLSVSEEKSEKEIVSITMDQLIDSMNMETIDLLKIDIEGAEFRMFQAEQNLAFLRKVKTICLEIHDEVGDPNHIRSTLESFGFTLTTKGETVFGLNQHFVKTVAIPYIL